MAGSGGGLGWMVFGAVVASARRPRRRGLLPSVSEGGCVVGIGLRGAPYIRAGCAAKRLVAHAAWWAILSGGTPARRGAGGWQVRRGVPAQGAGGQMGGTLRGRGPCGGWWVIPVGCLRARTGLAEDGQASVGLLYSAAARPKGRELVPSLLKP